MYQQCMHQRGRIEHYSTWCWEVWMDVEVVDCEWKVLETTLCFSAKGRKKNVRWGWILRSIIKRFGGSRDRFSGHASRVDSTRHDVGRVRLWRQQGHVPTRDWWNKTLIRVEVLMILAHSWETSQGSLVVRNSNLHLKVLCLYEDKFTPSPCLMVPASSNLSNNKRALKDFEARRYKGGDNTLS